MSGVPTFPISIRDKHGRSFALDVTARRGLWVLRIRGTSSPMGEGSYADCVEEGDTDRAQQLVPRLASLWQFLADFLVWLELFHGLGVGSNRL